MTSWFRIQGHLKDQDIQQFQNWLREMGIKLMSHKVGMSNWRTKQIKLLAMIGVITDTPKFTEEAIRGFDDYVAAALRPDGSSNDYSKIGGLCHPLRVRQESARRMGQHPSRIRQAACRRRHRSISTWKTLRSQALRRDVRHGHGIRFQLSRDRDSPDRERCPLSNLEQRDSRCNSALAPPCTEQNKLTFSVRS